MVLCGNGENASNPRRAPTPLRRQHLEKLTRSCLAMRDPTNHDDIGWGSSCRRYRTGFRNAWLPFQRHFLMVNLEFFRCRRFGNLMRYTSKMGHILKKGSVSVCQASILFQEIFIRWLPSLGETMLPSLASVFRCFKPLKGQRLPPIYEVTMKHP